MAFFRHDLLKVLKFIIHLCMSILGIQLYKDRHLSLDLRNYLSSATLFMVHILILQVLRSLFV